MMDGWTDGVFRGLLVSLSGLFDGKGGDYWG